MYQNLGFYSLVENKLERNSFNKFQVICLIPVGSSLRINFATAGKAKQGQFVSFHRRRTKFVIFKSLKNLIAWMLSYFISPFYFPVELASKCICCVKGSVRTDRSKLQGNRGRALLDILAGCKNICNLQIYPASLWIYNKWVQIYQSVSTSIMHSALHAALHRANISRLHVIFFVHWQQFFPTQNIPWKCANCPPINLSYCPPRKM